MFCKNLGIVFLTDGNDPSIDADTLRRLATAIAGREVQAEFVQTDYRKVKESLSALLLRGINDFIFLPLTDKLESLGLAALKSMGLKEVGAWSQVKVNGKSLNLYFSTSVFRSKSIPIIAFDMVLQALSKATLDEPLGRVTSSDEIYQESFRKIRSLIEPYLSGKSDLEKELIVRVTHAAADAEIAEQVFFSRDAIMSGLHAITSGSDILVDTEMVKAGLYDPGLKIFGCKVKCYLHDERTQKLAREEGITKTAAAVRIAVQDGMIGDVVVFGNSPTAVIELVKMVKAGKAKPSLIVATPCGFVNAAQSKELVTSLPVPWVTVKGSKGGSAVAATVVNFLASTARKSRGE